jgi:choline-sulfatase
MCTTLGFWGFGVLGFWGFGVLAEKVRQRWDMAAYDGEVRQSQARRWIVYEALKNGAYYPWDYQPLQKASERYMRNHMNLDNLEDAKRFPRGE